MEQSKQITIAVSATVALVALGCLSAYLIHKYNIGELDL